MKAGARVTLLLLAVLLSTGSIPFMLFAANASEERDADGNNPAYSSFGFGSPESEDNGLSAEDPGDFNALSLGASAGDFSTAPGISTEDELREVLRADAGGVVVLGGDIEICDEVLDWYDITNPLVIDLNGHSIRVAETGYLFVRGSVCFTGSNVAKPLFVVEGIVAMEEVTIAAEGDDAVAIYLPEGRGSLGGRWMNIEVNGNGAVGIKADGDLGLSDLIITAKGEDSVGILCDGEIRLQFSRVEAEGTAVLSLTGEYWLFCDVLSPNRPDYDIVELEARADFPWINGYSGAVGDDIWLPDTLLYIMVLRPVGNTVYDWLYDIPVLWDTRDVDTSTAGDYTVTCYPQPRIPDLPIRGLEPFTLAYHVVDPGKPYLAYAYSVYECGIEISFFSSIEQYDDIRLHMSCGEGDWRDITDDAGVTVTPYGAAVEFPPLEEGMYYFQLEVVGGPMEGLSNILPFLYSWEDQNRGGGGDRDGTGQGGNGELPTPNDGDPGPPVIPTNTGDGNGTGSRGSGTSARAWKIQPADTAPVPGTVPADEPVMEQTAGYIDISRPLSEETIPVQGEISEATEPEPRPEGELAAGSGPIPALPAEQSGGANMDSDPESGSDTEPVWPWVGAAGLALGGGFAFLRWRGVKRLGR